MVNLFIAGLFLVGTCKALNDREDLLAGLFGVTTLVNLLAAYLVLK